MLLSSIVLLVDIENVHHLFFFAFETPTLEDLTDSGKMPAGSSAHSQMSAGSLGHSKMLVEVMLPAWSSSSQGHSSLRTSESSQCDDSDGDSG